MQPLSNFAKDDKLVGMIPYKCCQNNNISYRGITFEVTDYTAWDVITYFSIRTLFKKTNYIIVPWLHHDRIILTFNDHILVAALSFFCDNLAPSKSLRLYDIEDIIIIRIITIMEKVTFLENYILRGLLNFGRIIIPDIGHINRNSYVQLEMIKFRLLRAITSYEIYYFCPENYFTPCGSDYNF